MVKGRQPRDQAQDQSATAAPATAEPSGRLPVALALVAVMHSFLTVAFSSRPGPLTWGIDLAGYLSPPARGVLLATSLAGALLLCLAAFGPVPIRSGSRGGRLPILGLGRYSGLALVPYAFLLWFLRTRSPLLGDQLVWLDYFRDGQHPHFSEPLAAAGWHGYVGSLRAFRIPITEPVLALLPVLCGLLAAILAWRIAAHRWGFKVS